MNNSKFKIILASQSPRRKALLSELNIKFDIQVSGVDETLIPNLTITEQSERLAYLKARSVFDKTQGNRIIIGADTIVVKDNQIFGKPKNKQDAINILHKLNNSTHQVITSLSVLIQDEKQYIPYTIHDIAYITFNKMTDAEIENWVNSGKALDLAGAYGIQTEFAKYIQKINGNYTTIVGLPIHILYNILKKYINFN